MPFLTIFQNIHSHTPTRPLLTIIMTVKIKMVNTGLKTIHKPVDRMIEKMANNTRVDNDNIKECENIVKTRYGRIVRKPGRLMYQYDHMNAYQAHMLGAVKMSYIYNLYYHKTNTFSYNFCPTAHPPDITCTIIHICIKSFILTQILFTSLTTNN